MKCNSKVIKGILVFVTLFWVLQTHAQPLSFEVQFPNMSLYVQFKKALETPDEGFLVLFSDRLTKIDRTGKIVWNYFSYQMTNPDPSLGNPGYVLTDFLMDNDFVYLRGQIYNSPQSILLTHDGEKLFDTTYLISWRFSEDPFYGLGYCDVVGDYIISIATTFINLKFDSATFEQTWENKCLHFQKINKFTGERKEMKTICLSDSNEYIREVVKINTQDKGYLISVFLTQTGVPTNINQNILVRIDSSGNLIEVNDMFPVDVFPKQEFQDIDEFGSVYDPEILQGGFYRIRHTFDTAAIGLYSYCKVGSSFGWENFLTLYDTNGKLVYSQIMNSSANLKNKNKIREINTDSFVMYDESGQILWAKSYPKPPVTIDQGFQKIEGYFLTSYNSVLRIINTTSITIGSTNQFTIQHIGPYGWDFGYDPDAPIPPPWNEKDSIHIWFNAQGNLSVPVETEGWQLTVSNTIGQQLYTEKVSSSGELPMPYSIQTGVYIITIHSPNTNKVYYRKVFKE